VTWYRIARFAFEFNGFCTRYRIRERAEVLAVDRRFGLCHRSHERIAEVRMRRERVTLDRDGRVLLPVAFCAELGLQPGDALVVECDGDSLLVRSPDAALQETQHYFRQFVPAGVSVVDELIADRRAEAERDEAETAARLDTQTRG
jgi:bifunctional DNA-binding transcriptional regulator/antitoxin component of YhaV-PrlF toxin-antitoxin module